MADAICIFVLPQFVERPLHCNDMIMIECSDIHYTRHMKASLIENAPTDSWNYRV